MTLTEKIAAQLRIDEGLRLKTYMDTVGKLTIGIGRCLETNPLKTHEMYMLLKDESRAGRITSKIEFNALQRAVTADMVKYGISVKEAYNLLYSEIEECITALNKNIEWFNEANDVVKEVLVNMCFNLGLTGLLEFKKTLYYLSIENYNDAADQMLKSKWALQVGRRAKRLANKIRNIK